MKKWLQLEINKNKNIKLWSKIIEEKLDTMMELEILKELKNQQDKENLMQK